MISLTVAEKEVQPKQQNLGPLWDPCPQEICCSWLAARCLWTVYAAVFLLPGAPFAGVSPAKKPKTVDGLELSSPSAPFLCFALFLYLDLRILGLVLVNLTFLRCPLCPLFPCAFLAPVLPLPGNT